MITVSTSISPREGTIYAWCPSCQGPQPCAHSQGTTDWQSTPVYTCRACGRVTHDPIIRLTVATLPLAHQS